MSNSDRITNDTTPTIVGSSCNVGETTILRVDGSTGTPLRASLCRTANYTVTVVSPLADGTHDLKAFSAQRIRRLARHVHLGGAHRRYGRQCAGDHVSDAGCDGDDPAGGGDQGHGR